MFRLISQYVPAGDQPEAIDLLVKGVHKGSAKQTLLGATGTGKTFTIANVIEKVQMPTLVIAHNKTLAAQLAQEYRSFFPDAAVHYFVSYYDYYQPEAYLPASDTYIEKDAKINEEIDRLRHASTQSLISRDDVIIVASVSCIYGLGSPEEYKNRYLKLSVGMSFSRRELFEHLIQIHYTRTNADLLPGTFRGMGNKVDIMPISERTVYSLTFLGNTIDSIISLDPVSSTKLSDMKDVVIFPSKHFLTEEVKREKALVSIKKELDIRLKELENEGKLLEEQRLRRRTTYDLAMIREMGYTNGIENYARHLSDKQAGEPPETLLSYFPHDDDGNPLFLTVIDESHVTVPQIRGMYAGDQSRKRTLVEHGFRLPSALDNRPLQFDEFEKRTGMTIYTTATPGVYERENSDQIVEQVIRPTGLVDPEITIKPVSPSDTFPGQVQDFIQDAVSEIERGGRVLATTLTKKMAEDLSEYLKEKGLSAEYLHSDIKTMERIEILTRLRKGEFDCLVGVNLLREGLDLPEVTFIGILDADKEGFLRSDTALIQTIGRAARNIEGRVTLYADRVTPSMERAIDETRRRREKQTAYNKKHNITPETIKKAIHDIIDDLRGNHEKTVERELEIDVQAFGGNLKKLIKHKKSLMNQVVKELDFETASILRDEIRELEERQIRAEKK